MSRSPAVSPLSLRPVAAALVAVFGLMPPEALALQTVLNCSDAGAGSLRQAVHDAVEGDLVDATKLGCSKITLTTGFILVGQNSLTINGPGADKLTVDGLNDPAGRYPVFLHTGTGGTLEIDHLTISNGDFYLNSDTKYLGGGCIFSRGSVTLKQTIVSGCTMTAGPKSKGLGGAIFADDNVTLVESTVSASAVYAPVSGLGIESAFGGAVFSSTGIVMLDHSTVSNNRAASGGGIYSKGTIGVYDSTISGNHARKGGGIYCRCGFRLARSTISGNDAQRFGGLVLRPPYVSQAKSTYIINSTLSGNTNSDNTAPPLVIEVPITISYSTIAFNRGPADAVHGALYSGASSLNLVGSTIAENFPADVETDSATVVTGLKNLSTNPVATMPGDTITDCPQLQPLTNNGGPTLTHALRHTSPAIDHGFPLVNAPTDQRGAGYPRNFGGITDIGSFEWHGATPDDDIFHGAFDAVPDVKNCDI